MNQVQYTNIKELSDFFNVQLDKYGEEHFANSVETLIEYDLKRAAQIVSETWALKKEFTDEGIRELLEVLYGTLNDLHTLRQAIVRHVKEYSKEE